MTGDVERALDVAADLRLEVDGVQAQLTGRGDQLVLVSDRPVRLLRRMARRPAGGRAGDVAGLARSLDAIGLTLSVRGPRGRMVRLGRDAHARRAPGAAPIELGTPGSRVVVGLVLAAAGAVGAVVLRRRRR